MVQVQKAPASHADLVSLKEQAKNHVVGETQLVTEPASQPTGVAALAEDGLNGTHSFVNGSAPTMQQRENGASASAAVGAAFAGGSEASDGLVASQNGLTYSQTGDLVGPGPDQVNANPSNPALPPPSVARSIPCRYFPNCRYGDSCAFSHNPEAFNVSAADGSVNGQAFSPTHASPGPDPGMGFFNPYAAPPQPGMPPMDYYGAPMGPGFYGPPPPAGAYPGYGPVPYYGYGGGYYPSPPESTSPALPGQQSAATSTVEGTASQEPGVPPSANGVASPCTSVSAESPVFVPQSSSVQEFSSQALTSPVPSAPTALAVGQVPAATQPNGPPKHFDGHRALRNSHAFNSSTNRRERGPTASSARTSIKGNAAKKPHQVACTFFHNNSCRLGDACQFSHILSDGSDAKLQASNIVGVDGRVGDVATLEEFKRTECLRKERLAATGGISHRPRGDGLPHSRPTAHHAGGHSRFTAPMQHSSGLPGVDHHYYSAPRKNFMNGAPRGRAAHNAPRLPSGEDFPALPAGQVSPRNESPSAKPATPSNIVLMEDVATPVSTDAELGSGVPSGASTPVTPASTHEAAAAAVSAIPKLVSSFASAAARGASAPPPPSRPHQQRGHGRNSKSAAPAPAPADAAPTPAEAAPSADPVAA